ncbi:excalibur calcium-binding domain-containing protein [Rothia sp. 27098_8_161]|uniref:excalibur calcium-binding domain-containing protein n=1 Tax=Rothia sp. 27098_8_161 TaxID=3003678 RepID=UPI00352BDC7F
MDIRHTITRFGATALIGCGLVVTAIPATFAQNGEESVTYVYADKAASHISEVWYKGEALKITGEGFLTQDGTSGSTIAIKLNKGTVKIDGKDYLEVQADEKGNFSVSIPWQDDLDERISVDVYLLSGSLKDNDTARGGKAATVKIEARSVQEATPSATASASASASATASVVDTPSASVAPSASATASASGADEVIASVDAEIKDRVDGKASATASASPSATASASASVVATPFAWASASASATESASASATESASASAAADKNASVANDAKDQSGDSTSATEQVTASAESTRFANCSEVAATGLAPISSSHPDFRKQFDTDNNGLGCEVINSEVTDGGSSSNISSGSSSRNSGGLDNLGSSSASTNYTSSRAQRSSLANTGASNAFTIAGMGLVALGLGVAGVSAVRNRKNS